MKLNIKKIPKPIMSSIVYMLVVFFQSGINLITTPIFSRILTTADYGITSTYQSWYNILSVFITLNLSAGVYNNALIDFEKERKEMTSSFLSISTILTFITFFIYTCFKSKIVKIIGLSEYLLDFMFINFLTAPAWNLFLTREKFDYNYIKPLIITMITFLLNPILGIIGIKIFSEDKAIAKVIFCGLPTVIVNFIMFIHTIREGKCFFNRKFWKYALAFNIPLIPHYLSGIILAQSDRIMIQKFNGDSAAGIYGVAYNLSQVIQGVFVGINAALIPFTYKSLKNKNYKSIGKYADLILGFVGIISILLIMCAPEIITILAPQEYYSATWVIPPIVIGLYFYFLSSLFGNIEFYYKKNIFVTIATSCAALLNIILNIFFIPKYGFIAAGYTTAVGYFILTASHYIFMKKIQPNNIYNGKNLLIISMTVFVITCICMLLYKLPIVRYLIIFIGVIICLINYKKIITISKKIVANYK